MIHIRATFWLNAKKYLLADFYQLHLKNNRGISGYRAGTLRAVGQLGRNRKLSFTPNFHTDHPVVKTLDKLAGTNRKSNGFASVIRTVEFRTVSECADVVD